jgi:hypothetical protein
MSDSEEGNNINNTTNISFDSRLRGYSRRHSYYDNAFNMDFEYGYLDLMRGYGTFVSRTHEMYANMETCISSMIEVQNERRLSVNRRRERARNNRRVHEQQHLVFDNDDSHDSHDSRDASNDGVVNNSSNEVRTNRSRSSPSTIEERDSRDSIEMNNNSRTTTGTGTGADAGAGTGAGATRRQLFDIGSVIYSIPRTVLLNPNTEPATLNRRRRRSGGLTISEIEENTEIMMYGSIPSNYILNTECPITRETFTPESVVLTLKQCKHCFVPFRMMTWLETHSTCPLCRANVIRVETPERNTAINETTNTTTNTNTTTTTTNTNTNNENDTNVETNNSDNISISNIFNNLLQNSNNDFNNLSIDSVNDNSIMFSFDLPSDQVNRQNSENNPFIIPQIERLMANTVSRNIFNNGTSSYGVTPSTSNNNNNNNEPDDEHYPEVD